jgi:hypothetical protein
VAVNSHRAKSSCLGQVSNSNLGVRKGNYVLPFLDTGKERSVVWW